MKGNDSVEENILVLGVGNLFSALQPPHCLPHVLGLQGRGVSPLLTDIQCWNEGGREGGGGSGIHNRCTSECIMGFIFGDTLPY